MARDNDRVDHQRTEGLLLPVFDNRQVQCASCQHSGFSWHDLLGCSQGFELRVDERQRQLHAVQDTIGITGNRRGLNGRTSNATHEETVQIWQNAGTASSG